MAPLPPPNTKSYHQADPGNAAAPSANTAAVITKTAIAGKAWVVNQLFLGYTAAPTGGSIQIEDGSGNIVFKVAIGAAGLTQIPLNPPIRGSVGKSLIITLAAGGAGISGTVTANLTLED